MAEVDVLAKGIKEIYETRGVEVFSNSRMFNALLDDLVPSVSNERRIIHKAVDDVLLKDLFGMVTDNFANKQLEAMKIIKKIEDSCGLSEKYSCFIVETFCTAFDVKVDFTPFKQKNKNADGKSNNANLHGQKSTKLVVKNGSPASDFDDKKFINDLYYCETTRKVLDDRIKQIDKKLMILCKEENAISKMMVQSWNNSTFFVDYKNAEKKIQAYPLEPTKPGKTYMVRKKDLEKDKNDILTSIFFLLPFLFPFLLSCLKAYVGILQLKDGDITGIAFLIPMIVVLLIFVYKKIIKKTVNRRRELKKYKSDMFFYEEECKSIDEENANASIENERLLNLKKKQYNEWAKNETKIIEEKRKKSSIVIENQKNVLNNEKEMVNTTLLKLKDLLDDLYSMKVNGTQCIHSNYHGFLPICIIYGYFDMGRCNFLKGYQGAYNLYEDEKSKGIINKKDLFTPNNTTMLFHWNTCSKCKEQLDSLAENAKLLIDNEVLTSKEILIDVPAVNDIYYKEIDLKLDEINLDYSSAI